MRLPLLVAVALTAMAQQQSPSQTTQTNEIGPLSKVLVQYTTDGEVTLSMLNITFVTTEMRVVVLGCDVGYFDNYALAPQKPSARSKVTPFDCRECRCDTFESTRTEEFFITET
jgi:hypothetical protein